MFSHTAYRKSYAASLAVVGGLSVGGVVWAAASVVPGGDPPAAAAASAGAGGAPEDAPAMDAPIPRPFIRDGFVVVTKPDGTVVRVPIPGTPAVDISTDEDREAGVTRIKLLKPEEIGPRVPRADTTDTSFFTYSGKIRAPGGAPGMQGAVTQDKLGVHRDVMRNHADLLPAFDAISKHGAARLKALADAGHPPPCDGGHWRVLVEHVDPVTAGGEREIRVFAGRSCVRGGTFISDGGVNEVWTVAPDATTPVLKSRIVTAVPISVS